MRRGRGLLVVAALLATTACSGTPDQPSDDVASTSVEPSPGIPASQQFTLDDQAQFDDGLLVEIAGSFAQEATRNIQGAESSGGRIVLASVRIENNTSAP